MPATFILLDDHHRRMALRAVQTAKVGQQVKISRPTRSVEQNKWLHGLLGDIADQLADDNGEFHDIEFWKPRCTLSWLIDKKREYEIITPFHREQTSAPEVGILIPHTSDLTTEQCAELIEWIQAYFTTEKGVVFKERAPEPPPREDDR